MLSVVIPVYNSAATLDLLATRLDGALDTADEVVLVDDGSADSSWRELSRIVATRPRWKALRLGRNSGQHSALLAGIRVATGDVLVTMDDDLQHPPEEIGVLVGALTEDADLVYGIAKVEEHGRARSFSSRLVKRLMRRSLGVAEADHISAFRCFRTQLRDALRHRERSVRVGGRAPFVGHQPGSGSAGRHDPEGGGEVELRSPQAGPTHVQHDHRL